MILLQDASTVIVENGEEIVKVSNMQVPNGIDSKTYLNGKYNFTILLIIYYVIIMLLYSFNCSAIHYCLY